VPNTNFVVVSLRQKRNYLVYFGKKINKMFNILSQSWSGLHS